MLYNIIKSIEQNYKCIAGKRNEKIKMNDPERKKRYNEYHLSKEQKKEIDNFYIKNYGKKVPYKWHQYYSSFTGKFDVKYIPELIFIPEIQEKLANVDKVKWFEDKNLLPLLVPDEEEVITPRIIISCVNNILRDDKMNFINIEQAEKILYNRGKVFYKITVESGSGKGCKILNIKDNKDIASNKTIKEILTEGEGNFNIQELIINNDELKRLNPSTVNTFRVVTYIWKGKLFHFPIVLRIGREGKCGDHECEGGVLIGVEDDGTFKDYGIKLSGEKFYEHPDTKTIFKGYKVKEMPKIIEKMYSIHERIPQSGLISWDVTLNDKNQIVIVEMNIRAQSVWLPQITHGKGVFGENTEEILQYIGRGNWRK